VVIAVAFEVLRGPSWHQGWRREWRREWRRGWRGHRDGGSWRYGIGDVDVTLDASQSRRPLHQGHLIGDIRLDLSQVQLEDGETPFELNALIGDITVLVPADLPVSVAAEVTVGDIRVFRQSADGLGRRLTYQSPGYDAAPRKVRIMAHLLVGDITVHEF
jgi:predicted membrane protein